MFVNYLLQGFNNYEQSRQKLASEAKTLNLDLLHKFYHLLNQYANNQWAYVISGNIKDKVPSMPPLPNMQDYNGLEMVRVFGKQAY